MLVILSEAKDLTIGMSAFASHVRIDEATMIEPSSDIPRLFAGSFVVCATRDDSAKIK